MDELEGDLCDLEVVKYHVIVQHLCDGAVVVVEDKQVTITFYLLLQTHLHRHVSAFPRVLPVLNRNPVKSNQVGAVVGLQLLDIQQESL